MLNEDDVKFLTELANEMVTQDNRATGDPYYFVVRTRRRVTGYDVDCAPDGTCFVETRSGDYNVFDTREEAIAYLMKDTDLPREEVLRLFWHEITETGYKYEETDHNFFLTHKGFLEHMRLNAHNYPGRQDGEKFKESEYTYSYVKHAFRNPEVQRLFEIIKKFATVEKKDDRRNA